MPFGWVDRLPSSGQFRRRFGENNNHETYVYRRSRDSICGSGRIASLAQAQQFINILTGGTSGVYYPMGVALGKIYGDKIPNVKTQVQATKASVENLNLLEQGRGEIAFTLGDSLKAAWDGDEEAGFKTKLTKLRTIGAIYPTTSRSSPPRRAASRRWPI